MEAKKIPNDAPTTKLIPMATASSAEILSEQIELHPYQNDGALWLSLNAVALLADEMGLGKSAQAITAADLAECQRVLVLCPSSAKVNWEREFKKFSKVARSFTILKSKNDKIPNGQSVISSYDLAEKISPLERFDALILDESHYLKSLDTKRTRLVFGKEGLVRRCRNVWALSGTPMPNGVPTEMWVLLYSFGATELGYNDFVEYFCNYYESPHGRRITGPKQSRFSELREVVAKVTLRRKKEDVLRDLPPITFSDRVVEASEVDLEMHSSLIQYVFPNDNRHELQKILAEQNHLLKTVIDTMGLATQQIAKLETMKTLEAMANSVSTLRRYSGIQKVEAAANIVEEELMFGAYDKIVIFAIHRDVIYYLRERLKRYGVVTLFGETPEKKRQQHIDKFQNNPKCRVFIGNIQASGTAINLTASNQVLFVEQSWTPADNAQAAMRCHRIGQKSPVFVRCLGLADSIDEKVSCVLRQKMKSIAAIFDDEEKLVLPEYGAAKVFQTVQLDPVKNS